jgi:hypothetical protein
MPDPWLYLKATVSAASVSALCVLALVTARRKAVSSWQNSACVGGIGLGLAVGYCMLSLQPCWPPTNALDRLLTIVLPVALGIELIAGFPCVPAWCAWFLRIGLAATMPRILLHGSVYLTGADNDWPSWRANTAMAVCATLLMSVWALLARLIRRSPGVSVSFSLCLTIQCAGLTVMMAGYIKGGAAALPIVAALMATTFATTMITKCRVVTNDCVQAIPGIGAVGLFGLLFIGHFFGRLSTGTALTILLAPLACWVTEVPLFRHRNPWLLGLLRLVLVAIPLAVVLGLAKRDFDRDMGPLLRTDTRPPVMIAIVAE